MCIRDRDYLSRLYTGFGVSQVILDIYEQSLGTTPRRPYGVKALGMSWRALRLLPKVLRKSDRTREGNEDYLRWLFCVGYLRRLWAVRDEYRALQRKIQDLALRLRGAEPARMNQVG